MTRLVLLAFLASCSADRDVPDLQQNEPVTVAERRFVFEALPVLSTNCSSCHSGSDPAVAFLAGGTWQDIRESLLASSVVDVLSPTSSRILTKGAHSGPSLTAQQASDLLEWLTAE